MDWNWNFNWKWKWNLTDPAVAVPMAATAAVDAAKAAARSAGDAEGSTVAGRGHVEASSERRRRCCGNARNTAR